MHSVSLQKQASQGFTLIEAVITMAIVSILVTVAISGINSQRRIERDLETNAREFASVLREAQNYALTGKQSNGAGTTCEFKVAWSGSSYTLSAVPCAGPDTVIASFSLKNGVVFAAPASITFALPWGLTSIKLIDFSKGSTHHYVCLSTNGVIKDYTAGMCP